MEVVTPSSYESGNRKRRPRRGGRPCDACRKRKTRCMVTDQDEKCVYCQLKDSTCTFAGQAPTRAGSLRMAGFHTRTEAETDIPDSITQVVAAGATLPPGSPMVDSSPQLARPKRTASALASLGLSEGRFAELYGLGSDMEPVLMVSIPC